MEQDNKPQKGTDDRGYVKWTGIGFEFAGVLAVFCYIGYKLDQKLNSSPWFLLAGFFVGFATMFYMIIKETFNIRRK